MEIKNLSQYTLPQKVFSVTSRTVKVRHGAIKIILK